MCLSINALTINASGNDALKQRFISEAPNQWKEYIHIASRLRGTVRFEQRDRRNGNRIVRQWESDVVISGRLASTIEIDDDGLRRATVENSRYGFRLRSAKDADWSVVDIEQNGVKNDNLIGEGQIGDRSATCRALGMTSRGMLIYVTWLPRMIDDPSFAVREADFVQRDGEQLVKVEFTYDPKKKYNNPVGGGATILDPGRFWLIQIGRAHV